jgi:hypothetical protein
MYIHTLLYAYLCIHFLSENEVTAKEIEYENKEIIANE